MCGIVGVINKNAKKGANPSDINLNNTFDHMLWADQIRGQDGTGVMRLNNNLQVEYLKIEGPYRNLTKLPKWNTFRSWVDASFFTIGHNRAATKGVVSSANSHPFESKHITLVHNGTLRSFPKKFQHVDPKFDVDSLALTRMIDELGIEKAVDEFEGAYACVWIDNKDKSLNIARNWERPLGMVVLEKAILLASEPFLAAWCASRNNLKIIEFKEFDVNTHYKMYADDMSKFIETKYTPKSKAIYGGYGSSWDTEDDEDAVSFFGAGMEKKDVTPVIIKPTKQIDKGYSKRTKARDKFVAVGSIRGNGDCDYYIGAPVMVQLSGIKTTQREGHLQFEGIIQEVALTDIRHKVIGTTALPYSEVSNFDQLYEAEIAAIMESQTGFYLVNIRNLRKPSDHEEETGGDSEKEAPKSFCLPVPILNLPDSIKVSGYSGESKQCDYCEVFFPKEEMSTITSTTTTPGKGYKVMRSLHVCDKCNSEIVDNFSLFDKVFDKKVKHLKIMENAAKAV